MDKNKVKELIEQAIGVNLNNLVVGDNEHNAPINKANALLEEAIKELSKSDWISVEDRLPEYDEDVFVCDKACPSLILGSMRLEGICGDNHNFIIPHMYVTHWCRIEKLKKRV